jgi:hypothetical protein
MGVMWLLGVEQSSVLLMLLVAALGLTFWETREQGYELKVTIWWLSLVAMTHVLGYIGLRGWVAGRKRGDR